MRVHHAGRLTAAFDPALDLQQAPGKPRIRFLSLVQAFDFPLNLQVCHALKLYRAYQIGQDKPVFVHKLLCQDTAEERIHELQQEKGKLAAGILADSDISNRLDASMIRSLLE